MFILILVHEVINEWMITQDVVIVGFRHTYFRAILKNIFCLISIYFMSFVCDLV